MGPAPRTVVVVGAGLVGVACAWWLQRHGHSVLLLDPMPLEDPGAGEPASAGGSGSRAALGVLMGHVFQRSSGRGWRLRQRSMELWQEWQRELADRGQPIPFRPGLLLLADSEEEFSRLRRRAEERPHGRECLELWGPERLQTLTPALPAGARRGLHSPADGQIDPLPALEAFLADGRAAGLELRQGTVTGLEPEGRLWRLQLAEGEALRAEHLVLTGGFGCAALLEGLGIERPLEPVLGQALELELSVPPLPTWNWPAVVAWRGINLIPRPDPAPDRRRIWVGATVEPGLAADPTALAELRSLGGAAPAWLRQAQVVRQWQGIRPRPLGRPAPLLEVLAPGLLLAAGHHRNGVLLAPATADWVLDQIGGP